MTVTVKIIVEVGSTSKTRILRYREKKEYKSLAGFDCMIAVSETDDDGLPADKIFERAVTTRDDNGDFILKLTKAETLQLTPQKCYVCTAQIENLSADVEISREVSWLFQTVAGVIG